MLSKKHLLSKYKEFAESYSERHEAIKGRMKKRQEESAKMKKTYEDKTSSLTRLRNK